MNSFLLFVNIDLGVVFLTLLAFMVPGLMICGALFKKRFDKAPIVAALVYYLVCGFLLGTLLFLLIMMVLIGGVSYIP